MKIINTKICILSFLILFGCLSHFSVASASTVFSDNLETYSVGNINAQGLWGSGGTTFNVISTGCYTGSRCFKSTDSMGDIAARYLGVSISSGTTTLTGYLNHLNYTNGNAEIGLATSGPNMVNDYEVYGGFPASHFASCGAGLDSNGSRLYRLYYPGSSVAYGTSSPVQGTWHKVQVQYSQVADALGNFNCRANADGGTWTNWYPYASSTTAQPFQYIVVMGDTGGGTTRGYDDFSVDSDTGSGGGGTPPPAGGGTGSAGYLTQFVGSVSPGLGTTTPTSLVTFSGSYYLNSTDVGINAPHCFSWDVATGVSKCYPFLTITARNLDTTRQYQMEIGGLPLTPSATYNFSLSTTTLPDGLYNVAFSLCSSGSATQPNCGFNFDSTTTAFIIHSTSQGATTTSSLFQTIIDNGGSLAPGVPPSVLGAYAPGTSCDWGSLDFFNCLIGAVANTLFMISPGDQAIIGSELAYLKGLAPWGYAFAALNDLESYSATSTGSLAAYNLTFTLPNTGVFATATSTSALKGKTFTFIDWTIIASSTKNRYWGTAYSGLTTDIEVFLGFGFVIWLALFVVNRMKL